MGVTQNRKRCKKKSCLKKINPKALLKVSNRISNMYNHMLQIGFLSDVAMPKKYNRLKETSEYLKHS